MKYIILLLLTFNSYADVKMSMMDLRNNSNQGSDTFETNAKAIERLVKIAKIKNGWREGIFNEVLMGSLYSKVEDIYTYEDLGATQMSYDEEGNETGLVGILSEVVTPTTFYYHPTNWSYNIVAETQQEIDDKAAIATKAARKIELKDIKKTRNLTLPEINEYLFD